MTYRVDVLTRDGVLTFEVQGLLDEAGVAALELSVRVVKAGGRRSRILLKVGTEVERSALQRLRAIDAELVAEPAYLATWLRGGG